ncbi:MAG: response regulator [Vicinamibacteria bacterium]
MATILIVDDRAENLEFLAALLGYAGHRVVEARNGGEALAFARRERPALVVTDLLMPVMDGFDLARALRAESGLADVRIVFYTATYLAEDARALARACGVKHILTKPAEAEDVLRVVEAALTEGPLPAEADEKSYAQEHLRVLNMTLAHKAEVVVPRLNAILGLSLDLASQLDPVRLLETFCERLRDVLSARWAVIVLDRRAHTTDPHFYASGIVLPEGWVPPRGQEDFTLSGAESAPGEMLAAPVHSPGTVYGHVYLSRAEGSPLFSTEEAEIAGVLGGLVGRIYENGSLYAAARKQADDLFQSEQRFRQLAENIPEVFWVSPVEGGRPLYVSPAYETVWGQTLESFYERPSSWLDAVIPEDVDTAHAFAERSARGETVSEEFRISRPDGALRWLWVRSFPVRDEGGTLRRIAGVTLDITDRRSLDQQFRQAQKMEAVGRLAGGVAHDFNNLIGVVMGYGESALRTLPPGHAARPKLDQVLQAAERATRVTRQLLVFSRKHSPDPRVVSLDAVIHEMERLLRRLIGEDLDLVVRAGPAGACIRADVREVEQVLMNLAVNARDAMPEGGRLTIETTVERVAAHSGPAERGVRTGDYVVLTVSDTGTGIPADVQPQIFEPFFTTKDPERGTGLGLSTVYGIVDQAQGSILLDSQAGAGASFRIYWPRCDEPITPVAPRLEGEAPRGKETILLVEDDDALRSVTQDMLQECGYTVLAAADGAEALRLTQGYVGRLDLLMTDVVMRGMTGPQTAQQVCALRPQIRVLLMSGYSGKELSRQGVAAERLLEKPFTLDEMARRVREALTA